MANPAYIWIVDEQGNEIRSHCSVHGREGAIEALAFNYGVSMPTDKYTGSTTGTRQHETVRIVKELDTTSPSLFSAACHGKTLQRLVAKWYKIDENGKEKVYFTHTLEKVKVVSYKQGLRHVKDPSNDQHVHEDIIDFRFAKITMTHHDGNIEASDEWTERS